MVDPANTKLPRPAALRALLRCAAQANLLLVRGQLRQPTRHRGRMLGFADGTTAAVYRETTVHRATIDEPTLLVVGFRLRYINGNLGHATFRAESLLNTILFVGFPGFVSKLWLRHDQHGRYRGVYQWDGADRAEHYVSALRHVLQLASEPGSIDYHVHPGVWRDDALDDPDQVFGRRTASDWWRLTGPESVP